MKTTRMRTGQIGVLVLIFFWVKILGVSAADYIYTTNADDTLTLTYYTGSGGDVVIPTSIGTHTVSVIGELAFFSSYYLTSVTIPDSITNIGSSAFAEGRLTNAVIGKGTIAIDETAFYSCTRLLSITVADDNPAYSTLDGVLFDKTRQK